MRPPVRLTLQRLAKDQQFTEVMASLRAQGWKDWHLLLAVVNIVVNGRARRLGVNMNALTKDDMERVQGLLRAEERPGDPMPPADVFTEDAMWVHLANAAVTTMRGWGLELRVRFEPRALLAVLGDRFNYWDDDVAHEPIFTA
jgi:hypothetical protein